MYAPRTDLQRLRQDPCERNLEKPEAKQVHPRERRALETNFDYFTNISIRYTFGSIFNAIVNPRFDRPGGGVIFF